MDKIREFFGFPKERYHWNEQDAEIAFMSIFLYMGIAALPFITKSEESMHGYKITAIILLAFSLYSFIAFIVISVKVNKKK